MKNKNHLIKLILSALFLALAFVLPFLTVHNPNLGNIFCLMHIPVLICGFVCGWPWGLFVGFTAPLLRSLTIGMPLFFPTALCMAFELAAYGATTGIMHKFLPKKKSYIYCSLLIAMVVGRIVLGITKFIAILNTNNSFLLSAFITDAFVTAIPGIIIQIAFVPIIVMLLGNPKIIKFKN